MQHYSECIYEFHDANHLISFPSCHTVEAGLDNLKLICSGKADMTHPVDRKSGRFSFSFMDNNNICTI